MTSDQRDTSQEPVRFTLQQQVTDLPVTGINPSKARDAAINAVTNLSKIRKFNKQEFNKDVAAADAMIAGWTLHSPASFHIEETDANTYKLHADTDLIENNVIELTDLEGDEVVKLNTLWDITLPENRAVLLTHPFIKKGAVPTALPKHIHDSPTSLYAHLLVDEAFTVSKGEPIMQVIPLPSSIADAEYTTADESYMQMVQKEQRRKRIYPSWYSENRDHDRSGDLSS